MRSTILLTSIICISIFSFTLIGCVKEKADTVNPPNAAEAIDVNRISDCHKNNNPFPSQISLNIEGSWVLTTQYCPFATGAVTVTKQVVLTFNDGALFKVFENGRLKEEGSYTLTSSSDGNWTIGTSSIVSEYLYGHILLCGDELVLNSSFLDGCDYYFVRR